MKVPKAIFKLAEALDDAGIDYRIVGGQAAVFYGLRDEAEDWDIAVEEVTEDLKEIMRRLGFVEIPDTESLSWEGPTLVDFLIADGEKYPTIEELGIQPNKGLQFVVRSMMGYINWKKGKSAYQHLKRYKEMIDEEGVPEAVKEKTDLSRFEQYANHLKRVRNLFSRINLRTILATKGIPPGIKFHIEDLPHFTLSDNWAEVKAGVVDFIVSPGAMLYWIEQAEGHDVNVLKADIDAQNVLVVTPEVQQRLKFREPLQTFKWRGSLRKHGYDALLWPKRQVLQVLDTNVLKNIEFFDMSDFVQHVDNKYKRSSEDETRKHTKDSAMTNKEVNAERVNPIPGGIGDSLQKNDVDPDEIEDGIEVEQEHVKNSPLGEDAEDELAMDISFDHLAEIPNYYAWLAWMEEMAKRYKNPPELKVAAKLLKIAQRLEGEGLPLQACLLDRLLCEAKFIEAQVQPVSEQDADRTDYSQMAQEYRKRRIANEVFTKLTGIPVDTLSYYRKIATIIKDFKKIIDHAETLDHDSQKYIELIRYVTDQFNTKYDPYNTDHAPTKIKYIAEALRIYEIIEHNLDKAATPELGTNTIIEKFVEKMKEAKVLQDFNKLKKVISAASAKRKIEAQIGKSLSEMTDEELIEEEKRASEKEKKYREEYGIGDQMEGPWDHYPSAVSPIHEEMEKRGLKKRPDWKTRAPDLFPERDPEDPNDFDYMIHE